MSLCKKFNLKKMYAIHFCMGQFGPNCLVFICFFNFIINKLNQTSSLFNFSFMRLFLSHNPAKRAALLAV
ncbi:hypothetical protein A31O_00461 [Escherichia coli KTE170]|nr:hypothetical protein A31O_00461 [Escherichia coli KTE170]